MFFYLTKISKKPNNILLTMKEHNDKNVTTLMQVYINVYQRREQGHITEM